MTTEILIIIGSGNAGTDPQPQPMLTYILSIRLSEINFSEKLIKTSKFSFKWINFVQEPIS